jgi:hypothetical protein
MGLITIGGQQVYVVDSKPVATARASNGVGYAQLVSQQRWKLYEEAEKNVLREMEFEKMGYQAQLDAYTKQKEQLTKALARAQEVKNKIASGGATFRDLVSLAKADADAEARAAAVRKTTNVSKDAVSPSGKPRKGVKVESSYDTTTSRGKVELPSERLARLGGLTGIKSPKELEAEAAVLLERDKKDSYDAWTNAFNNRTDKSLTKEQWILTEEGAPFEAEAQRLTKLTPAQYAQEIQDAQDEDEARKQGEEYISSLESQLESLSLPEIGFDTNVGARAREAYAGMVGMGGLGLAPRKSKTSAVYDESRAREAMARQAAGFEEAIGTTAAANEADLRASLLKGADVRNRARISELQAASDLAGPEDAEFKKLIDQEIQKLSTTAPALTPEEEANIKRTSRQAAEQSFRATALETGPGLRTLGSFMDRAPAETGRRPDDDPRKEPRGPRKPRKDIDFDFLAGLGALATEGIPSVYFGSGDVAEAGLSGMAPEGALTTPGRPPEDSPEGPNYSGIVADVGFGATTTPESGALIERKAPSDADSEFRRAMRRLGVGGQPGDYAPSPVVIPGEAGIGGPPYMPNIPVKKQTPPPNPTPNASGLEQPGGKPKAAEDLYVFYGKQILKDDGTIELVPLSNAEKEKIWDKWLAEEEITSKLDDRGAKEWYSKAMDEIKSESPPTGKTKKKTRLESYSANLMNIMQKGQKLADQPTKLQRLAKLDLPEKDRAKVVPEHILLVDKLYNINSAKGDAFQTTFAEIERVYKNDEKKKKAAQEYLAAKEILTA